MNKSCIEYAQKIVFNTNPTELAVVLWPNTFPDAGGLEAVRCVEFVEEDIRGLQQ